MTALSEQATRVALDVEEIAEYDRAISDLEYQICDCKPEDPSALEDEKKRLQEKANRLVNNLKDEGIELAYDGRLIQVKQNGHIWLELDQDGWREHEIKEAIPPLAAIEQGTTEYLARILKPGSAEPEYFVPQGIYLGIAMATRSFLETALLKTYPDIQIVSEEEFQQAIAQRGRIA